MIITTVFILAECTAVNSASPVTMTLKATGNCYR